MLEAHMNYFDMAVIGIMFLSCLFSFFRGFVREILSLTAWVGAGVITVYYFPSVAEMLRPHFTKPITAAIIATSSLYVGSLVIFAIFNRYIIKILKSGTGVGILDNLLGLVFGALRGAFIISLGFFMLSLAIPANKRPEWLAQSITRPYAENGAITLTKIAPTYLNELSKLQNGAAKSIKDNKENASDGIDNENKNIDNQVKIIRGNIPPESTLKEPTANFDEILSHLKNTSNHLSEQQ